MLILIKKAWLAAKNGEFHRRFFSYINKSRLRYALKFWYRLRYWSVYSGRKKTFQNLNLDLSPRSQKILETLKIDGFCDVTEIILPEKLDSLNKYSTEKINMFNESQTLAERHKDFWSYLSDSDLKQGKLPDHHPLVQFALQDEVLKIAGQYLESAPCLTYSLLTLSKGSAGPLKSSQLWHLDHDDTRLLKLFVYLTDVQNSEVGPFTLLNAQSSSKVKNSFFEDHLPDDVVFKTVSKSEVIELKKPRLAAFMVDTSRCYHMGSRTQPGHFRLLYTSVYVAPPGCYPWQDGINISVTSNYSGLPYLALHPLKFDANRDLP